MTPMDGILRKQWLLAITVVLALLLPQSAWAQRTELKPGWNLFSPAQDVEVGKQVSADAEKQLPMLNDQRVNDYLNRLGRRLAAVAPGEKYPYQFSAVNDSAINAFALPGGFLYINRGIFEAAANESQLAGVMAHEIGHVALRHGTNQASKAYLAQAPLAILGGVLGSNSVGAVLAQVGAGFAVNSVLLKYSRNAERQSDLLGTQILFDNQYDPRAMAQFFEIIAGESEGGRPPEFFSSHPNPENRVKHVTEEIARLGGNPRNMKTDSNEFQQIKRYIQSLPPAPKASPTGASGGTGDTPGTPGGYSRPQLPSSRYETFQNDTIRMRYPDNWRASAQDNSITIAPEGGAGSAGLAYGMIGAVFETQRGVSLEQATDQLVAQLRQSNPRLNVIRRPIQLRIDRRNALGTLLENESPLGGRELDFLVTVEVPGGLIYFVYVAPEQDFDQYERTFQTMIDSIRIAR